MKKILLSLIFCLPLWCFAQATTETKQKEEYCMVIATRKMFSSKVSIAVDYGQETSIFGVKRLKDEEGKLVNFNSVIDALNYMAKQGWTFVNAYVVTIDSERNVLNYVMRREL